VKPRTKNIVRWIGLLVAGTLLLLVLLLIEEHIRGDIALNRHLSRMSLRGEKFAVAELTPVPAPPDENGAGLMMGAGFPQNRIVPAEIPASMRYLSAGVAIPAMTIRAWSSSGGSEVRLATNVFPATPGANLPTSKANTNLPTWARARRPFAAKSWTVLTADSLAKEIAANSNSLAQVRAALACPQLDHLLPYAQGFSMLLPHLPREKAAGQWLRAASLSALHETDTSASLQNLLALAALSHASTNEAIIISQLVRIAILHMAVSATWEALQTEGWKDAQLEQLQAAFAPNDFVSGMTRALDMERAIGVMTIDRASRDPALLKAVFGMDVNVQFSPPSLPATADEAIKPLGDLVRNVSPAFNRFIYYPIWNFAWKDHDKLHLMQHWQAHIEKGRSQALRANWSANKTGSPESAEARFYPFDIDEAGRRKQRSPYDRVRFLISSALEGVGERTLEKAVTADASQQLAVTAISIRRFQIRHGKAPNFLSELAPRFLAAIPTDPFDGEPLRYKRSADGEFTLYSVGTDGMDENGDASPLPKTSRPTFQNGRDLVWPRAATTEEIQQFIEAEAAHFRSGRRD
jgi:hypothetical protein